MRMVFGRQMGKDEKERDNEKWKWEGKSRKDRRCKNILDVRNSPKKVYSLESSWILHNEKGGWRHSLFSSVTLCPPCLSRFHQFILCRSSTLSYLRHLEKVLGFRLCLIFTGYFLSCSKLHFKQQFSTPFRSPLLIPGPLTLPWDKVFPIRISIPGMIPAHLRGYPR